MSTSSTSQELWEYGRLWRKAHPDVCDVEDYRCPVIFYVDHTSNLPGPSSRVFVTCTQRDMQPYKCESIIADDVFEALGIIARTARDQGVRRWGVVWFADEDGPDYKYTRSHG